MSCPDCSTDLCGTVRHLSQMIYCNAEGIVWVDNYRIAIASDKAKARQPYW